ncbi:hypothetical protein DDB_G0270978 [Dictyostelium discoideum AX4]|uniref:Uncharacterized protein n=1 Tax=Dictyostelium discoideum TaxID=44689 RepID=Q55CX6_DICDI|nr:hypothetical protein DDB_G0270978 [Dictyostelium discoideum AX4]EAL72839.2 hypothetical protein DDB_G0270978 [Dictyostelium discoideum AX4]|eukprot:XP_646355.2 hypothetical protein DDB_G0270978 [Dictyostelium discoideum AX4]
MGACGTILLLLLCIFFLSPVAVLIKKGCSSAFWLNLILFFLGIIPGIVHGIYVILS